MIADPAIDIGMLLYNYVPQSKWSKWFKTYGVEEYEFKQTYEMVYSDSIHWYGSMV